MTFFQIIIATPLEQFQLILLYPQNLYFLDIFLTNLFVAYIFMFSFFATFSYFSKPKFDSFEYYVIPNNWQLFFEMIYFLVISLLFSNLGVGGQKYLFFIAGIFIFILFSNLMGLVPYSFTLTSHLTVTFFLAFSIFLGITFIGVSKHRFRLFSLFIPPNTTFFLALILVPIEFISYLAKPVSLGVRLFINLMAGHTLLKVIAGFAWSLLNLRELPSFLQFLPFLVLVVLFGLELGVALIQAYVFTILLCIYLNDVS